MLVLNKEENKNEFFVAFLNISDFLELTVIDISSTKSFFKGEYLQNLDNISKVILLS